MASTSGPSAIKSDDFLRNSLDEITNMIQPMMRDCSDCTNRKKESQHTELEGSESDSLLEDIQRDLAELAEMVQSKKRDEAITPQTENITGLVNQLDRVVQDNHQKTRALTYENFQSLEERKRIHQAELLRVIMERQGDH